MERQLERAAAVRGIQTVSSGRGTSSHHHNPAIIICGKETTEDTGLCYGINLVYSGNFSANIEVGQTDLPRANIGVGGDDFCFTLAKDEAFSTPEAVLTYSENGLAGLSHRYHNIYRNNLCLGKYKIASSR